MSEAWIVFCILIIPAVVGASVIGWYVGQFLAGCFESVRAINRTVADLEARASTAKDSR